LSQERKQNSDASGPARRWSADGTEIATCEEHRTERWRTEATRVDAHSAVELISNRAANGELTQGSGEARQI
jgi:hypothetical protein